MERSMSLSSDDIDGKLEELETLKNNMLNANIGIYCYSNQKVIELARNLTLKQSENNDTMASCKTANKMNELCIDELFMDDLFVISFSFDDCVLFFPFSGFGKSEKDENNFCPYLSQDIIIFNPKNFTYEFYSSTFSPLKCADFVINKNDILFDVNILDLVDVCDRMNKNITETECCSPIAFDDCIETAIKKLLKI